jgi:hypothetical protein
MKTILLLSIALFPQTQESKTDDDILIYENYTKEEVNISDGLSSIDMGYYSLDSIIVKSEYLLNLNEAQKLSGSVFDILFEQDIINQWSEFRKLGLVPKTTSHEDFIKKRQVETNIYFFKRIFLNYAFDSYLVIVSYSNNDMYNINRSLYLVNTINNKIKSITQIARLTNFEGSATHLDAKIIGRDIFCIKEEFVSSDIITPDINYNYDSKQYKFFFDQNGYLKLL